MPASPPGAQPGSGDPGEVSSAMTISLLTMSSWCQGLLPSPLKALDLAVHGHQGETGAGSQHPSILLLLILAQDIFPLTLTESGREAERQRETSTDCPPAHAPTGPGD